MVIYYDCYDYITMIILLVRITTTTATVRKWLSQTLF